MATENNIKKEYVVLSKTQVKCTGRETKADIGGTARTFDMVLDFSGISDARKLEWAAATAVIRVQNNMRKREDAEAYLAECEKKGSVAIMLANMAGEMSEEKIKGAVKAMSAEAKKALLEQLRAELGDVL
jgi:hypothetical protein